MANIKKNKSAKTAKNVAIIMDGNGRWAISNSLNISKGHSKGVEIVREIVEESVTQKISSLTLYAFSSENWSRPKPEIEAIKKLIVKNSNVLIEEKLKGKNQTIKIPISKINIEISNINSLIESANEQLKFNMDAILMNAGKVTFQAN